jgi:hypothetical protein
MRDNWCTALRSKKYKQGQYHLCADGRYCCLGVLCELNLDKVTKILKNKTYNIYTYNESEGFLPRELSEKKHEFGDWEIELMKMNDSGKSFDEIADWIEQNVPVEEDSLSPTATESGVLNHG